MSPFFVCGDYLQFVDTTTLLSSVTATETRKKKTTGHKIRSELFTSAHWSDQNTTDEQTVSTKDASFIGPVKSTDIQSS